MHELSIAQSIMETVLREQEQRGLPAVTGIGLRIGGLSGVQTDALQFSFEAIITGTPLANCRLVIEHVPVQGACQICGQAFKVQDYLFCCPACRSGQIEVTHGYEMDIDYLEVEDKVDPVDRQPCNSQTNQGTR